MENIFNTDNIKVSVICLTYNQAMYIEDAICSFLMQKTTFDFEIIIHDDASTDGTADIIKKYQSLYPKIIKPVFQTENQHSKNIKIYATHLRPLVKGKYVAFCEGDDFWTDKYKLQKQFDYMESHIKCSMCIHHGWNISKDKKVVYTYKAISEKPEIFNVEDALKGLGTRALTNSFFCRFDIDKNDNYRFMKIAPTGDYTRTIFYSLYGYIYYIPEAMSAHRAMAKNSWTMSMGENKSLWNRYIQKQLAMLDCLNLETNYRYRDIIENEKIKQQFNVLLKLKDKSKLNQPPFLSLYQKISLKDKLMYFYPRLFKICQYIVHIFRRNKMPLILKDLNEFKKEVNRENS